MDLEFILSKTKNASDKIKRNRDPVNIAIEDRPYNFLNKEHDNPKKAQDVQEKNINSLKTNRKQTVNKVVTNRKQTVNKVHSKPTTKITFCRSFSTLVGLQRSIMILIYQECKKSLSKITDPLTLEYISSHVEAGKNTLKTNIYRLVIKKYLIRKEFKNGRGGWTRYWLPEEVFHEILQNENSDKLTTNRKQTVNKVHSKPTTNTFPLSSSSYYNTTTEMPEEWLKIDLFEASEFGFTNEHVFQLYKLGTLESEIVNNSIDFFLFDLKNNNKATEIKTNPISYFMGIMKRIGFYSAPENYESKRERAMRIYLANQKKIEERECEIEEKIIDLESQKWIAGLSEEEKQKIIPDNLKNIQISAPRMAALRTYFKNSVWQDKRKQIVEKIDM